MANRYSVLLEFLENLNSNSIFEFEGKKNYRSYLAPSSQTVGSLLRTPGQQSQMEKWIRRSLNLTNNYITKNKSRLLQILWSEQFNEIFRFFSNLHLKQQKMAKYFVFYITWFVLFKCVLRQGLCINFFNSVYNFKMRFLEIKVYT